MTQAQGQETAAIRRRVKRVIVHGLRLQMAPEELDDDEALFGGLGADSTAVLEIVAALEEEFGFEVEDEDLTEELMASVGSLTAYVAKALKTCPACGRLLTPVGGEPRVGVHEASQRFGLEVGRCGRCGCTVTGRRAI